VGAAVGGTGVAVGAGAHAARAMTIIRLNAATSMILFDILLLLFDVSSVTRFSMQVGLSCHHLLRQ
jgi:hypothetical protein